MHRFGVASAACFATLLVAMCTVAVEPPRLRDVIDQEIAAVWQREQVTPARLASDAEFLRRVSLDLVGDVPTYDETIAFLADSAADKRSQLIDRLLDDPRYAQHMSEVWDLLLFGRNPPGFDTDKRDGLQAWLRKQFAENVPYDETARALLKAEGNSIDDGPPLFYMQYKNQPEDATEAITQIFLGVQLQCARCHDHPFESWKQVDFYGMAAFVARLELVTVGKQQQLTKYAVAEKSTGEILFTGPAKDQSPGKKGDPIKPRFLLGDELREPPLPKAFKEIAKFTPNKQPPPPVFSRKNELADWITRADNPFFAKAIANRLWAQFLGKGLVHPVDNMSPANAPSHPTLLTTLSQAIVDRKFDVKWYVRELVNSKTYQLSSTGTDADQFPAWYAAARVRPLSAEELAQAWRTVTGYEAVEKSGKLKGGSGKSAKGGRFRPFESSYMLRFFGTPNTGTGEFQGGMHEHLYLNNGPMSSVVVDGPGSLLDTLADAKRPIEDRVERLYLSVLQRRPSEVERTRFAKFLTGEKAEKDDETRRREAVWALITSSEFRFNH